MTTPSLQYAYANGTSNTIRPTSVTYPNGRAVSYNYGTSGGIDDSASRVASLVDSDGASTHLADYSYLGLNAVVQQDSPEADLRYTLVSLTGANDPDTGDIYAGLDRFGRVQDVRWRDVSAATDLSRIQYGYDRASNRTWRANPTDPSQHYDWLYGYDGLQRLKTGNRGTLNGTQTAITSPQFGQCWTLDPTGNWSALQQSDDGTTWTMKQSRTSNPVNEITAINGDVGDLWATPRYDANGNMTTIPRPQLERPNWANLTVDEWADLTKEEWSELEVAPKFTATYDAWNRLTKLADAGNGQTVQENQYDGRNYRTVTKTYTNGSLVETRHHYYTDNWQCVEERVDASTTPNRQFVWGIRYIDDLICRDRSVSGTLDERLYGCQDANWNLTAVVNDAGAVQERYEYDPYGDVTFLSASFGVRTASSYGWETLYAGYRYDATSNLYAVRYRYYHPRIGTWVTRDPIGYRGCIALFQYVLSQPASDVDPSGLAGNAIDPATEVVTGILAGQNAVVTAKYVTNISGEKYFYTMNPAKQLNPIAKGRADTSTFFIFKGTDKSANNVFRLDYGPIPGKSDSVWHQNVGGSFKKLTNHKTGLGITAAGRAVTIFKRAGKPLFVLAVASASVDIYYAENRKREITKQLGMFGGAIAGARVGGWAGANVGASVALIAGVAGPQAAAPEEIVTVPVAGMVGGIIGGIGGGIAGAWAGQSVTEYVWDTWLFPIEKEEWMMASENSCSQNYMNCGS